MFERYIDKPVLEVLSKLGNREPPNVLIDIIGQIDKASVKKLLEVSRRLDEGETMIDALKEEKLISDELYLFLKSAENNRNLDMFAREKLVIDKEIDEIKKSFIFSMVSPFMALIVSFGVVYIFIYKVIPGFNINEKHLSVLPSYFPFIFFLSKNLIVYLATILGLIFFIFGLYALRKNLPVISDVYLLYERLKLYTHLFLSVRAGYNIDEALRTYKGALRDNIDIVLSKIEEGQDITDAFIDSLPKITPIERPIVVASIKTGIAEDLKDLYTQTKEELKTRLEVLKQGMTLTALLLVSFVILFAYLGILMPIIKAVRSMMS